MPFDPRRRRLLQTLVVGAAALRVLAVSIVRDRYSGRIMARVMSLSFLVFLGVPILAPALGQLVLTVAPWPWIFGVLGLAAIAYLVEHCGGAADGAGGGSARSLSQRVEWMLTLFERLEAQKLEQRARGRVAH